MSAREWGKFAKKYGLENILSCLLKKMRTRFVKHLSLLSFLIVVVFFVLWFIMPGTNEIKISLGSDYYIIDDGMSYCLVLQPQEKGGKPIVEGGIRSWNEDKRNIVVFRVLTSEIKQWYDIKTSDHYEFWIIDKKNGSVYGPLDFLEYLEMKEKNDITMSLSL